MTDLRDSHPQKVSGDIVTNAAEAAVNQEWQLSDFVDAIAAEVDRAEDTLSLKSYARGVTFALKQLNLELEVKVRRDPTGRILFRTTNPDEASATVLKLDLAQMLQSQLHGIRKPLEDDTHGRDLRTLPEITDSDIAGLNTIAIYTVDDLERYTQSPAMIAEVSRKSGVSDAKLRKWLHLPYIAELKPASGAPGSQVMIEGGNFGPAADPTATFLFQGQPARVLSWSDSRILVQMPIQVRGAGVLFAVINAQTTNTLNWEAAAVDLVVQDILVSPQALFAGEPVTLQATLVNQGATASAEIFDVQWLIDDKPEAVQPHGILQPGQASQESSTQRVLSLPAGTHQVRFIADPNNEHPDLNRANSNFVKTLVLAARRELRFGDYRQGLLDTLDNLSTKAGNLNDIFGLISRGLLGYQIRGATELNIASSWRFDNNRDDGNLGVIFELGHQNLTFHDGQPITVNDVVFTYKQLRQSPLWGNLMAESVRDISADKSRVVFVLAGRQFSPKLIPLFMVGLVPMAAYQQDPSGFKAQPIGCGPFKVAQFDGKQLVLDAFEQYYLGRPRVDRISIGFGAADGLAEAVKNGKVVAATLPYSDDLAKSLGAIKELMVTAVPEIEPSLLYAQSVRLRERMPNKFDLNANAHLWYLAEGEKAVVAAKQKRRKK